jgi:hypothetical protein
MQTQSCKYCGEVKPFDDFKIASTIKGVVYRRKKCQKCYQNTKKALRNRNRKWLDEYKKTLKCNRCDENDFRVLDFHHTGQKDLEISLAIGRWGKEKILNEIAKCEVLCVKCHRILHYNERNGE